MTPSSVPSGRSGPGGPRATARLAGALLLFSVVCGGLAQAARGRLVVAGDAAATAGHFLAGAGIVWQGMAAYLGEAAGLLAAAVLLYRLFRPAGPTLAAMSVVFAVLGVAVKTAAFILFIAPLTILGGAATPALTAAQRQALAMLALDLNSSGALVGLVFLGVFAILKGVLIVRSTFVPRFLGVLGIVAGAGWLAFVVQPFGLRYYGIIVTLALVATAAQVAWFLSVGVREAEWYRQAAGG